ncbi:MAG: glycoside hydrolase family 2 TIM barrel-domain containing protein, partial [Acutalibacteraceae bacterium]
DPLRADVPGIDSTGEGVVSLTRRVTAPHLWSDEDPYLYTLVISLYDKQSGKHFESIAQQLGFREITFTPTEVDENYNKITKKYEQMLLNGKPLVIKGVNRHDIDPLTGRYVSRELYETDLRMIKQYNFNALRTSHYPNDEYLYHLCDQYGILVMAEANMESNELQNDSDVMARQLEPAYLDRITANMQERKNRTSVIMWSLGNECGNTPETKMFQRSIQTTVRPLDATRPVNYEPLGGNGGVDIWTTMYPAVSFVIDRGANTDRMPYMPIEYNHAMGNACGYFKEYWDAFRRYDNLLGGYIWDWVDQGLATPLDKSAAYSVAADQSRNGFTGELTGDLKRDAVTGKQYLEGTLVIPSRQDADNKINEALSSDRSFTMEMVVRPRDPSSTDYQPLMKKGDSQVGLRTHNNAFDLVTYVTRDGSKGTWAEWHYNRPASWGNGDWQHLALTYDGKTHAAKLYLNGTLINSTSTPSVDGATIMQSTYDLAINYCTERGRPGQNDVAVARIYTRALNAQEIAAQRQAYLNNTAYTIPADSDDVLMWLDFASAKLRPSVDGSVWDYYGEQGNDNLAGQYLGYGGDWGDVINTGNFCANGLVSSDRTPQAELQEIQYVQQPLRFTAAQRQLAVRQIEIFNESQWLDTARYLFQWELQEDGVVIDRGDFTATIAPQATQTVSVPFVMPSKTKDDGEYFLNVTAVLAKDTDWAQAGQVVGWQQFAVAADIGQVPKIDTATLSSLTKSETADTLTLSGEDFTLTVNKKTGLIGTYTVKGQTVLTKGPAPNFWRATIDNDGYFPKEWETANQGMTLDEMTVTMGEDDTICVIDVTLNLPRAKNSKEHLTYTVYGSGAVGVRARLDVNPEMGELLKFGAELTLPAGYENVTWFGNGPEDTFIDRRQGGQIGLYSSTVSDSFFPYAKPQASGNHTDVRYIALEEPGNPVGLMVVGENPLEASALHFKTGDYAGKRHPYQMPSRDNYTILNVDQISRGVGQSSCGPSQLAQYQLPVNYDFDYAFTILPYDTAADDPMTLSKPWRVVESPADPAQPSGYETAEIARFGGMERTINGAAINGGSLYADWTRANDNRVADLTGYDPANLRLRVRFELHAPDESVPPATWFKSGYVKLRSEQRADPAVNNGDPEHNYGWDINASWNLQYGENAFDIPLADALQGRFGNDSRTMYGSNNRKGQIDWTRIDRMIFVISAPNYNGLRMNVTYAAVVDTAFEKTLARLTELTESPLTQGSYTDASYAAYTDALKRGADVLADKRATLEQAQNAAAYLENTQAELTADPAAVLTAALRLRVSEAAQMDSLAVTPDALQAFEEALAAAQGVLDHDGVTQDEVDAALAALEKAIAGLTTVCRPGDVDESGAVTAADALMALQAATGKITLTTIQKMAADVDGQNGVTAADALAILQFATGKITAF